MAILIAWQSLFVERSITKIDLIRYIASENVGEHKKSPSAEQVGFAEFDRSEFRS
jgi:hypothetical protein